MTQPTVSKPGVDPEGGLQGARAPPRNLASKLAPSALDQCPPFQNPGSAPGQSTEGRESEELLIETDVTRHEHVTV